MRWASLLLLLALPASAHLDRLGDYPRLDRRDRLESPSGPLLSMALTATGASECNGATPSGLTFTRSSSAICTRSDGTLASLASNAPRVSARGLLVEGAATNLVLHSSDLTQAAWAQVGVTCSKTATGPDGVANSASGCASLGASGYVVQALTTAAATRASSLYVGNSTCSAVEVTRDGSTWTAVAGVFSGWLRFAPSCLSGDTHCVAVPALSSGIANPTVGVQLTGSGCTAEIALVQDEAGAYATSPIATAGTAVTRAGDDARATSPLAGLGPIDWCMAITAERTGAAWTQPGTLVSEDSPGPNATTIGTATAGGRLSFTVRDATSAAVSYLSTAGVGAQGRAVVSGASGGASVGSILGVESGPLTGAGTGIIASHSALVSIGSSNGASFRLNAHLSNLVIDNTTGGCP